MANLKKPLLQDINTLVGINGKSDIVTNDDAVANAVVTCLICQQRSRKFRAAYGTETHFYLQRAVTPATAVQLQMSVYNDLKRWVGSIASFSLEGVGVAPTADGRGYLISVAYASNLTGYQNQVNVTLTSTATTR